MPAGWLAVGGGSMPVEPAGLDLPEQPGVYLFRRGDGRVLYVGKATVLRERVRSYFAKSPDRQMIPKLVDEAESVDCMVTRTPAEALMLERQLIRKHRPRYNSMLLDDRSYPFIAITDDATPRIIYSRHPPEGSLRWGPFPDAGAAKRVIQLLRRHFGIRDCKELLPEGCLSMHIGLCAAPCIDAAGYDARVAAARRVLDGDAEALLESLRREMDGHSAALEYEAAAQTRDLIDSVQRTVSQQVIHSRFYREVDAIGFASRGDLATVLVLHAKDGVVQGQVHYPLVHRGDVGESVARVLTEHYASTRPPRTLLLPCESTEWMLAWLRERRNGAISIRVPQRGELAKLRRMADSNAEMQVQRVVRQRSGSLEQLAADEAAVILGVESLDHLVCFDMAQLQGAERVGAAVTFRNGRPVKKEYRTYTVKSDAADDLQMMSEVVQRWLKRQQEWPDLLLLDGGETHLSTILQILDDNGLTDRIRLAALAKREETLHRIDAEPLVLDRRGRLFVHARDEAHRFVNRFHRKRRDRGAILDPLEEVEGLGAKKLQSLLRHFGGRKGIEFADIEELQRAAGIGPALATRIHTHLRR